MAQLRAAATRFRLAIEGCNRRRLPEWFREFPRGCCGDTAELLARYLKEEGFGSFRYICGYRKQKGRGQELSHAWLRQGDIIIDIAADQFPDMPFAVLVVTDSPWHRTFEVRQDHEADYQSHPHVRKQLDAAYQAIMAYLAAKPS